MQERITQKPIEVKRWQITSQRLSIAAAAAVLFVTVSLLFWMRESNNREQLTANGSKKVEAVIAPVETSDAPVAKSKIEVEKVIAEAKKATYANNSQKTVKPASEPAVAAAPAVSLNEPSTENVSDGSLRSIEIQKKSEMLSKGLSSALAGKVSGIQINKNSIKGTVYGEDKLPLAGASVKLKGSLSSAITDNKGQFNLGVDSVFQNPKLTVASIGYLPKEISARRNEELAIELKPNNASLSEVAITAANGKQTSKLASSTVISHPEPVDGWDKFEDYVLNNNKLLVNKKTTGRYITLNFEIDNEGKPININPLKRIEMVPIQTEAEEKEAIRLIKDGPKWILPLNGGSSSKMAFVNIKF